MLIDCLSLVTFVRVIEKTARFCLQAYFEEPYRDLYKLVPVRMEIMWVVKIKAGMWK